MDILSASGETPRQGWLEQASTVLKRTLRVFAVSAALAGIAYLALQPNAYEASAEIQLTPGTTYEAETARLLSQPLLAQAVTRLSPDQVATLRDTAADPTDIATLLQRSIQLHPADGAGIVRVVAVSAKPASALGLATAVIDTYLAGANDGYSPLNTIVEQRLAPDARFLSTPTDGRTQALYGQLATAIEARITLESRADLADNLLAQENFYALTREFDNAGSFANRVEQLGDLQGERDELAVTLLPNHPTMRAIDERITALIHRLRGDGANLAEATRAAITAARQTEAELRTELNALSTASENAPPDNIDRAMPTGSIDTMPRQLVRATVAPRSQLMGPGLGSALVGGFALLGQVGMLAIARPRSREKRIYGGMGEAMKATAFVPDNTACQEQDALDLQPICPTEQSTPVTTIAQPLVRLEPAVAAEREAEVEPIETMAQPSLEPPVLASTKSPARLVVISSSTSNMHAQIMANDLLNALGKRGQRVAIIDAGSRRRGAAAGLTDLAAGRASYADVIQLDSEKDVASVSWGRLLTMDFGADPVRVLVQALRELYDTVVVVAGKTDPDGSVPFPSLPGALAVNADAEPANNIQ